MWFGQWHAWPDIYAPRKIHSNLEILDYLDKMTFNQRYLLTLLLIFIHLWMTKKSALASCIMVMTWSDPMDLIIFHWMDFMTSCIFIVMNWKYALALINLLWMKWKYESAFLIHFWIMFELALFINPCPLYLKRRKEDKWQSNKENTTDHVSLPFLKLWVCPSISLRGNFEDYMRRGGIYLEDTMHFESSRLKSFFLIEIRASPVLLATAGFYATGDGDETRCFSCGIRYLNWRFRDQPLHVPHKPWCRHSHGGDRRNVPFQRAPLPLEDDLIRFRLVVQHDEDLHRRLPVISDTSRQSFDGILVWPISDYRRLKHESVAGQISYLVSPPFYTSRIGYKMRAIVYLNGDGPGRSTHLSVFMVLMKGDHDHLLPWPFQKRITFYLLDQGEGQRLRRESYVPDPRSRSFERPRSEMNSAFGCPLFVSHEDLENRNNGFLSIDTFFIKVIVHN